MENKNEIIEVLNDLVLINNDRIMDYEKAIRETRDTNNDLNPAYLVP